MLSDAIYDAIEKIAQTSSKNEKEALVKEFSQDDEFNRVLEYAYNPFKRYYIANVPTKSVGGGLRGFNDTTWEVLDSLASRELSGNAALQAVSAELDMMDEDSAELLKRIIKKDLRAGFGESTINKAIKGLIPDFPYMRCSLPKDADLDKWPWTEGIISQEKADGMFANIDVHLDGAVTITSRQGSEFPIEKFLRLANEIAIWLQSGMQYHGEIIVKRDGVVLERQIGNGILNSVLNGGDFGEGEYPHYMVWDAIPLSAVVTKGKYPTPYKQRIGSLVQQIKAAPRVYVDLIPTKLVTSLQGAYAHASELMKLGKEGTVIKHPSATWKDGTSKEQIKLKLEFEVDLEIVGIVPGKDGTKNEGRAGSFACQTSDGKLKVDVTVKNEALRDRVDADNNEFIGKIIPVIANDILEPSDSNEFHSLFLPRMAEANYRLDKTTADDLERVYAAKEVAILGEAILKEAA